jgi:hypothetical protein
MDLLSLLLSYCTNDLLEVGGENALNIMGKTNFNLQLETQQLFSSFF